ncbi:MAG: LytTR family transcriptional regulator [Phreatobacter sp.]|uniref:LytTR family DNA-binding domain-containing protein n=1 Tax=Phreatobacter sp. TaxID=1966341 RepID=UPI001A62A90F|nr:LytTR family DNA-binding domain-containing protein [Phreatobacter sp.]MBL8570326.1 LytTR family transcriptional regulator [Phreatobacter sp.]
MTDGGAIRPSGLPLRLVYGLIALGTALTCLVNAFSTAHDLARLGRPVPFWQPLLWEATSGVVVVALTPLVHWFFRQGQAVRDRLVALAAIHLGGALAFSLLHVGGMVLLRKAGYAAFSTESYVFGPLLAGFLYELRKDALVYSLIVSVFWMAGRFGGGQPARIPEADKAALPVAIWLRDGTTSVRVAPADIVWVVSAGNYVEFCLASGEKYLIRTTLQSEEERLRPLGFVRIHRMRLVNALRLRRIEVRASGDFEVEMDTGERLGGSRRYRADAMAMLRPEV